MNRLKFGRQAPRYAERVWIDPDQCKRYIEAADLSRRLGTGVRQLSGRVVETWPSDLEKSLCKHPKLTYCLRHWQEGKSWDEAGGLEFMLEGITTSPTGYLDEMCTKEDIVTRFESLDSIWADVKARGSLPPRNELKPGNFREIGGILVHIGPDGEPLFSGAGCHRFAMALMLEKRFPAQLGIIHKSALAKLPLLRRAESRES
ncbi:hypothetical protein ACFO0U_05305 [Chromohalobacter sarecensis]|uniref:ParB/Sulfiredoxin domain-containing protein n=1 Tax=Chromohalobacter sarecensis TaxID=245294 RepID=A0ABV9CY41_9GAMM|nr:hypothetical protein [Chromohalobacter sarecensis]MCK0713472.1 hypothetical protein [Chromohalobacter sarecensis]